jgi:hypothetical protein
MRVWLVERDHGDRTLVSVVYATPDGERALRQERSLETLARSPITAARDVDPGRLDPVPADDRERYAAEAARMRERHDPDDEV